MRPASLMTGALATPVMGRLADGPFKRRVIEVVLCLVLLGCVLSAVSTTFLTMVIGRSLQGVGLGLLPVTKALRGNWSGKHALVPSPPCRSPEPSVLASGIRSPH